MGTMLRFFHRAWWAQLHVWNQDPRLRHDLSSRVMRELVIQKHSWAHFVYMRGLYNALRIEFIAVYIIHSIIGRVMDRVRDRVSVTQFIMTFKISRSLSNVIHAIIYIVFVTACAIAQTIVHSYSP